MSTPVETNFDFKKNQALNFVHQNLSSAPATPVEGQVYFNSTNKKQYYWDGSAWVVTPKMATDAAASTGTAEDVTINPKQLKAGLDTKQASIGYTPENINNKVISLSSSSTDTQYPSAKLLYDLLITYAKLASPNFTGTPTAPTATAGDNSTQIANTEFVTTAITAAMTGGLVYKGAWDTTSAVDYSALNSYRPIKKGWMFRCTGTGCVLDMVDYKAGDVIIFNRDVSSSTAITTAAIDKFDHTENEDTVLLNAVQTLTNKTINASNNTISNLALSMFASGVILTAMSASPSDTKLLTEKAISNLLALKAPLASPALTGTPTAPTPTFGDDSTKIATTEFVQDAISDASTGMAKCQTFNNPALTPADGKCTWIVSHTLGTNNVISEIYEVSTGAKVIMDKEATSSTTYTIRMNASSDVAANTYKVVLMGVI